MEPRADPKINLTTTGIETMLELGRLAGTSEIQGHCVHDELAVLGVPRVVEPHFLLHGQQLGFIDAFTAQPNACRVSAGDVEQQQCNEGDTQQHGHGVEQSSKQKRDHALRRLHHSARFS